MVKPLGISNHKLSINNLRNQLDHIMTITTNSQILNHTHRRARNRAHDPKRNR
ncbi:hypothetical protein YC2023_105035 [Brassica napus]